MNFEYEIKYMNGDDIIKLEKYLHQSAYHETQQNYYFKFNEDRSMVAIRDKNGYFSTNFTLNAFIDKAIVAIRMFFKFKHLEDQIPTK